MKPITYKLRLDAYTNECQAKIHAKQFDTGTRNLSAVLVLDDGAPYDMEGVAGATLYAKRPDGLTTLAAATISNGEIVLDIPSSIFSTEGTVECELMIYDADSNQLTSPRFDIVVEGALYDENAVTATDDWTALVQKLSELERFKNGLVIKNCYATLADLEAAVTEPLPGDTYGVGAEGSYAVYTWAEAGEWKNMGALSAVLAEYARLAGAANIPDGSDMHTMTTVGTYYCENATHAATLSNCPVSAGFRLYINNVNEAAGCMVHTLISEAGAVYEEHTSDNGSTWSAWTPMYPLTAADVGAVPVSRTVNSKALSSDITLSASDVGAVSSTTTVGTIDFTNCTEVVTGNSYLRKQGNVVQLYLFVKPDSTINDNVTFNSFATLPTGFRPAKTTIVQSGYPHDKDIRLYVQTSGSCNLFNASGAAINTTTQLIFSCTFVR